MLAGFLVACSGGGGSGATSNEEIPQIKENNYVLFASKENSLSGVELFIAHSETGNRTKLSGTMVLGGGLVTTNGGLINKADYKLSPDESHVAYRADQDTEEKIELFLASTNGSSLLKVNFDLSINFEVTEFSWSPDSKLLAYVVRDKTSQSGGLYLYHLETSVNRKLNSTSTSGLDLIQILWSPDGRYVSQIGHANGPFPFGNSTSIFVSDSTLIVENSQQVTPVVTEAFTNVFSYKWSPNSANISYWADYAIDQVHELYVVEPDGSNNRKVGGAQSPGDVVDTNKYTWSPDSKLLAYPIRFSNREGFELYAVSSNGTSSVQLTEDFPLGAYGLSSYAWTKDSKKIIYTADQDVFTDYSLYAVDFDGQNNILLIDAPLGDITVEKLSPDENIIAYTAFQDSRTRRELYSIRANGSNNLKINPALDLGGDVDIFFHWSPDSTSVLYRMRPSLRNNAYELYQSRFDGSEAKKINASLVVGGDVTRNFSWSPDGSAIVYLADLDTDEIFELYAVKNDSSGNVKLNNTLSVGGEIYAFQWVGL